jgi:hypothetical protein
MSMTKRSTKLILEVPKMVLEVNKIAYWLIHQELQAITERI